MRASEFDIPETVVDIQWRHIVESMPEEIARQLFENSDSAADITLFLDSADTIDDLTSSDIGKNFFPINLIIVPDPLYMSMARFNDDTELTQITHDNGYRFRENQSAHTFPLNKANALMRRLVFKSRLDFDNFELLLKLKFSTWTIAEKIL